MEATSEQAKNYLDYLKNWCALQERCAQEIKDKLFSLEAKLNPEQISEIISVLEKENYLSEERFARAYAGGKFRIKKWGRMKIRMMLKQKRISESVIRIALESLNAETYLETLSKLIAEKKRKLKTEKNPVLLNHKLIRFAQSRGFETDIIIDCLKLKEED
jgi:regulatory protein